MTMRFTKSKDGTERADVRVTLRLSRDELAAIKDAAREEGEPWRTWLAHACEEGLSRALLAEDRDCEQRYGKGGA